MARMPRQLHCAALRAMTMMMVIAMAMAMAMEGGGCGVVGRQARRQAGYSDLWSSDGDGEARVVVKSWVDCWSWIGGWVLGIRRSGRAVRSVADWMAGWLASWGK